jgi:phage baseplate assembly protein gpV
VSGQGALERLTTAWTWRPIPNCPGRFVLVDAAPDLAPRALVGGDVPLEEFRVPTARDAVIVARFADGGLISYRRTNGTYVHTLNTPEGFARKLQQLGVNS